MYYCINIYILKRSNQVTKMEGDTLHKTTTAAWVRHNNLQWAYKATNKINAKQIITIILVILYVL